MKWKVKPLQHGPVYGQERIRRVFLWLPETCNDGYVRWLEFVTIEETYSEGYEGHGFIVPDGWICTKAYK